MCLNSSLSKNCSKPAHWKSRSQDALIARIAFVQRRHHPTVGTERPTVMGQHHNTKAKQTPFRSFSRSQALQNRPENTQAFPPLQKNTKFPAQALHAKEKYERPDLRSLCEVSPGLSLQINTERKPVWG